MGSSRANEVKIFKQQHLNDVALDTTYDKVGSVSPLKYRPTINLVGQPEPRDKNQSNSKDRSQSQKKDRNKMRTPDPMKHSASRG